MAAAYLKIAEWQRQVWDDFSNRHGGSNVHQPSRHVWVWLEDGTRAAGTICVMRKKKHVVRIDQGSGVFKTFAVRQVLDYGFFYPIA